MNLIRALFHKRYDKATQDAENSLRALTETTFEGKTIVRPEVLFASAEFKTAEKLIASYQDGPTEMVYAADGCERS